jgi:hypothetical protein
MSLETLQKFNNVSTWSMTNEEKATIQRKIKSLGQIYGWLGSRDSLDQEYMQRSP